jgi:hypothetical protein
MKAVLEFNLPDEQEDYMMAQNGNKYLYVLQDLDNYLRGLLKYTELSEEVYEALSNTRSKLNELLNERNVQLYD